MGGDGPTGSGGEEEDAGLPEHRPKDAVSAPDPDSLLPGTAPPRFCCRTSSDPLSAPQSIVQQFLVLLMTSSDESLRFLSFRLDFNEHYRSVQRRGRTSDTPRKNFIRSCHEKQEVPKEDLIQTVLSVFLNQPREEAGGR